MKLFIPVVAVLASAAGGIVATKSTAAPPSAQVASRPAALKPASGAAAPPPGRALPQLNDQQRAQLLQRIVQSRHLPVPPSATTPQLDREYIKSQMRALLPLLKECYESTLRTQPALRGKLVVDFTIVGEPAIGGLVSTSSINAAQSTIADVGMRECVQETIYGAQFPAPDVGGELQVTYPFEFDTDK